jgi:hypothetical protein
MALLPEINYNPAEDTMQDVFDKMNGLVQAFNAVLGGMTENQAIRKASGDDFDFEAYPTAGLNMKIVDIPAWNMNTDNTKDAPHGLTSANIKAMIPMVRKDNGQIYTLLGAGMASISGSNIFLERYSSDYFQSANFQSTAFNRGYIIIFYVD